MRDEAQAVIVVSTNPRGNYPLAADVAPLVRITQG